MPHRNAFFHNINYQFILYGKVKKEILKIKKRQLKTLFQMKNRS